MSEQRLVAHVHVRDEDGRTVAFGPGDEVPAWAVRQITNPRAWGTGEPGSTSRLIVSAPMVADDVAAPPRSGRGSGVEAWRAFAERLGVDVGRDASREDVIEACEAAGVVEREE
ncbi:hypothetical protein AB0J38_12105 [Streptomyces sp. NPDC050095]|uniref:hypothetical protein n=1 Tax=unclassified Streptomyces TaxID=2593676 RepID=UPI00343CA58E